VIGLLLIMYVEKYVQMIQWFVTYIFAVTRFFGQTKQEIESRGNPSSSLSISDLPNEMVFSVGLLLP